MALIIFYCCVLVIPNSALGHLEKNQGPPLQRCDKRGSDQSALRLRERDGRFLKFPLVVAYSGIYHGYQHVNTYGYQHNQTGDHHHNPLDQRIIPLADCLLQP